MNRLLGLALGLLAASCAPGSSRAIDEVASPLVAGVGDPHDTSVVMLLAESTADWVVCSGVVVAPHVVLTAAHCLSQTQGYRYSIFLGDDYRAQRADPALFVEVAQTTVNPMFDPSNPGNGHDLGAIQTVEALVPPPVPIYPLPPDPSWVGQPVRMVGYGLTDPADYNSDGRRTELTVTLSLISPLLLMLQGASNSCGGDSGGPTFATVRGKELLIGIHSFARPNCLPPSYDARLDIDRAFIDQVVAAGDPAYVIDDQLPPDVTPADAGAMESIDAAVGAADAAPDSTPDAGADAGARPIPSGEDDSSGCSAARGDAASAPWIGLTAVGALVFARRRRRGACR